MVAPISVPQLPSPAGCPEPVLGFQIRFPGGKWTAAIDNAQKISSACDVLLGGMIDGINLTMISLGPIFEILATIQEIIDCIQAIPNAIAQANPQPVIDCIPGLAEHLQNILALLPPITVPLMILDILCLIGQVLDCLIKLIDQILDFQRRLERVLQLALDRASQVLQDIADEAKDVQECLEGSMKATLKPLNPLIKLANTLGSLVPNFQAIPEVGQVTGTIGQVRQQLADFRTLLGLLPQTCLLEA